MAGRRPKVIIEQETYHETKEHKEAREKSTPIYQSQEFKPPETLTKKELEVWNWLVNVFRNTVNCMVSDADVQLMELYCRAKVATDEADQALKKDDRAYVLVPLGVDKDGKPKTTAKPNPKVAPNFCMVLRKHLLGLHIKNIIIKIIIYLKYFISKIEPLSLD